ncbi:MAG TPA: Mur ligase family protein, partial [Ktedonobacterales bacterium]
MIQLEMLREATNGDWLTAHQGGQAESFAHDSRAVSDGQCFVAIRGAQGDGHDHLEDAVANGATSLLMQRNRLDVLLTGDTSWVARMNERGVAIIAVDDTRAALRAYAARVLATWQPYVIAVAGSAGKTTTKEAIAEVLSLAGPTFRSWRNYNDLLGVPLSLGALTPEHQYAVIELAADHPGEMAELCDLVHPRLGVLTCAAETHLRYFGTAEAMVEELAALPAALPADGLFLTQLADPVTRVL